MSRDSLILGDMMLEIGVASINKEGEVICGDVWCQTAGEEQQIIVLSDGMGSGETAALQTGEISIRLTDG